MNMANKCKIIGCHITTSWALYTCVYSVQSYLYKYRKQNMSAKQGIHKWSLMLKINMVVKCLEHMHITADFKAYWATCFTYACSDVESICRTQ